MAIDLSGLGRWTDEREFKADAAGLVAYAAATNDTQPRHRRGELGPPVFGVVPVWEAMQAAVTAVTPADTLMQVVHSAQDIVQHRPVVPGDVVRSRAAPVAVLVRGMGTTLVVKTESRDAAGSLLNEQHFTLFFRGVSDGESGGEAPAPPRLAAAHKAAGPLAEVAYPVDRDQTLRYADAAGDRMPIHLDDAFARSVGLPGVIVHGLCTLAFAGRAVIDRCCPEDPARLTRLAGRFSRPVLPGQTITTRLYAAGVSGGKPAFGFETLGPAGHAVVKDGWVEIAEATR